MSQQKLNDREIAAKCRPQQRRCAVFLQPQRVVGRMNFGMHLDPTVGIGTSVEQNLDEIEGAVGTWRRYGSR